MKIWIYKFRLTLIAIFFTFLWGGMSLGGLPREDAPLVDIPQAIITTVLNGASGEDIEKNITNILEQKVKNISGVDEVKSFSRNGISTIIVEFDINLDRNLIFEDLQKSVDEAVPDLPTDILREPQIQRISTGDSPILILDIVGDYPWSDLRKIAETIDRSISGISGVKEVNIRGTVEPVYHIYVSPEKLEFHQLSFAQITQTIQSNHRNTPLGSILVSGQKLEVSVDNEFEHLSDFQNLVISTTNGQNVTLDDIAEIRKEFKPFVTKNFVQTEPDQVTPSVSIEIIKSKSELNILETVEKCFAKLDAMQAKGDIPDGIRFEIAMDGAADIKESMATLSQTAIQTFGLIFIVLWIFLGIRAAILANFGVISAILLTMIFLDLSGRTFNFISVFGLILAIGLVVDNAIIIIEGIFDALKKHPTPRKAALASVKKFTWPIVTGTSTTIFAFLPMLFFITGVNGEFISHMPITIIALLTASLITSLAFVPAVSAALFTIWPPDSHEDKAFVTRWESWYDRNIRKTLEHPKKVVFGMVLGLVFMIFLAAKGFINTAFFPKDDQNYFTVEIELPIDADIAETEIAKQKATKITNSYFTTDNPWGKPVLENVIFTVGGKSSSITGRESIGQTSTAENILGLTINMIDKGERNVHSEVIASQLKSELEGIFDTRTTVKTNEISEGPPTSSPIEIKIAGPDAEELAIQWSNQLKDVPEIVNITDSLGSPIISWEWNIDSQKASKLGISLNEATTSMRAGIYGQKLFSIFENSDEIDVEIRMNFQDDYIWETPRNTDILSQIPIRTPNGFVSIEDIATAEIKNTAQTIEHDAGERVVFVRADLAPGVALSQATRAVQKFVDNASYAPSNIVSLGGDNQESNKLVSEMGVSMLVGMGLIFLTLILQFNSFRVSGIVLSLIPFSLVWVLLGFFVLRQAIAFPTMIGIVALAGIIVNDAIVYFVELKLLQKTNTPLEALVGAGRNRFRAVVLTSITTVLGMLPLVVSSPVWGALGLAIIFGMLFSTILTLFLGPCLYRLFFYKDFRD